MSERITVKITVPDKIQNVGAGATGYVHGYMRGGNDKPCAVIVCKNKLVLVPIENLEIIQS